MQFKKLTFENAGGQKLSARLDLPIDSRPLAYAIFAHCFTCTKNIKATANISRALAREGVAVLRFDFTGLGESEGDFADTNFSSNVDDLVAAAEFLAAEFEAPRILIGHSLGGAAILQAAPKIPSSVAVATIAAPSDPSHVLRAMGPFKEKIKTDGEAEVMLADRPFKIKKQFIQDLEMTHMRDTIQNLKKSLVVFHSPLDQTVGIENAARIFKAARHPKSFISLDKADHLLTNPQDSEYVAAIIAAWAKKFIDMKGKDEKQQKSAGKFTKQSRSTTSQTKLPVIPADRADDLHNLEIADSADLVLFMAGNQFMAMDELISAFQQQYPDIRNIFYETLPPGLELKQILAGGATFGDEKINVTPDIYTSVNEKGMQLLQNSGVIDAADYHLYLHNRLALMVPEGNPAAITNVSDLGKHDVRVSQPDPANEDIAFHIMEMYRRAGGRKLVRRIMEQKRVEGTTIYTIVHHRETPLRISKKTVDVGPVWATEIIHAQASGLAFGVVEPGADLDQREHINYYICKLSQAPNPQNAQRFIDFILSPPARQIYQKYGFVPHSH
jgi:ABC-type molybdate transport system substrate-binding protein/alpha/beta superfamily hydrolase